MATDRDEGPVARRLWGGARPFLLLLAGVVGVALVAGLVFSRTDPRRAAQLLLAEQVVAESEGAATEPPAPTSGVPAGGPTCGVRDERVGVQQQVDAIAAGVVVVQYRDPADRDRVVAAVQDRSETVLVAPNDGIPAAVVATAWRHRLRAEEIDERQLRAFVTAYEGLGPDVRPCVP